MTNFYGHKKYKGIYYPGDLLKFWLEEHKLSQAWLCRIMGRPEKTISEIITGKNSVTAKTATELEKVTDIRADWWLQLQNNVDIKKVKGGE